MTMFERPNSANLAGAAKDPSRLGLLPEIAVVAGLGLVLVAVGDTLARSDVAIGDLFFWGGILAILAPVAWRLLGVGASANERLGLVVMLGLALYVVKVLHSPSGFTLYDELQHLRTFDDIATTGGLFARNPLLLVSPLYPGLEIATSMLTGVTGSSPFEAGVVVIGAARVLLAIGLFLFLERAADDERIAGIGAFVYMANPNFLLFDAQFGYQSLAIGLAVLALYLTAVSNGRWLAGAAGAVVVAAASIVTHHVTTYALIAFLVTWTIASRLLRADRGQPGPGRLAILTLMGAVAWLVLVASETVRYLGPRLDDGLALIQLLLGEVPARQLFAPTTGVLAPEWERVVGYGGVILLLVALPIGLWRFWRRFRSQPIALVLALVALSYPGTLALRLTQGAAEVASRASTFVFLGLAFAVALALTTPRLLPEGRRRALVPVFTALAMVVFVGGIVVGTPRWGRLPGPYLPSADTRSIGPEGIDAANWARTELGPGNRIVADRIDRILMGSYGSQNPVTNYVNEIRTFTVFYSPTFGPADLATLKEGQIDFLVIDRRLAGVEPLTRYFFENGEPLRVEHRPVLLTLRGLTKFGQVPGVNTVFDSGNIVIYDVRELTKAMQP